MTQQYPNNMTTARAQEITNVFLRGVYAWMSAGLAVTAVVAWFTANSETMLNLIFGNSIGPIALLIGWFVLGMGLGPMVPRLSAAAATGAFMLFSAVTGLMFSSLFISYTMSSIASTFVITAGMFGAMALYGSITKRDLTGMGSFMTMGLIGLILVMIVNIFLQSEPLHYAIGAIGVIIFAGLTAYDVQKLRNMGLSAPYGDATAIRRGTILGALTLFLDFINLFLMLLRLLGDRR
jgi:FtsH-binding integral membrane protein